MEKKTNTVEYVYLGIDELLAEEKSLVLAARKATEHSHSPYSNFKVGCAVKVQSGQIITGANQENASYGLTVCAERTTIFSAHNFGHSRDIRKIAVTGRPGNISNYIGTSPLCPCGACRQVIKESEDLAGKPIIILMDCFNDDLIMRVVGIETILPFAFGPADLGIDLKN